MIVGSVDPVRHPVVTLVVRGFDGQSISVPCLIDTGFNGGLTLPTTLIQELGLVITDQAISNLADGSRVEVPIYRARVMWDGAERVATVVGAEGQPLLGTSLLLGYRLMIEVVDGGRVSIESL